MAINFRQTEILELIRRDGRVTVDDLSQRFEVTVQTIRRDLSDLSASGRLERVHGGAVMPSGVSNILYEERRRLNDEGKRDIAGRCAQAIPDGSSIFMDIGTSTEAVALELTQHENLLVVTNNLNVVSIMRTNPTCRIIVAGGEVRRTDSGIVGSFSADLLRNFKFDYAVLSCSALDADGELLDFDPQETLVSQVAISRAKQVFVVADHMKFERKAPIRICSLRDAAIFFTDMPLHPSLAARCAQWGTKVNVVSSGDA
ncbi:transcriptional regulator, DeoR family [Jannaschia faecimaris]|uniref:Transcriptional regulator, DeoR family n=1 Tax=Jannaschia faecimaris TaxID=1244108 RepID=A0A1H3U8J8_9RHOB|nr:DeoR/GlpR family DNA-binding transcription regulator [Jannaschia faecimaris]SDZ57889.1 transcriptional regulator, DeoR family [Jannaschia faecimaris]